MERIDPEIDVGSQPAPLAEAKPEKLRQRPETISGDARMDHATILTLAWTMIHFVGLVASWFVRLQSGCRFEGLTQACFLFCLLGVSLTTLVGHVCCFEFWHLSAATLTTMILLAVVDFRLDRSYAA